MLGKVNGPRQWCAKLNIDLVLRARQTVVSNVLHDGPLRIQKSFLQPDGSCHVYLLHPPGGMVGGDQLSINISSEDFTKVLEHYRDYCGNTLVLKHIILHFNASFWSSSTAGMVQLIKDAKPSNVHSAELYEALGKGMSKYPPPANQRMTVLNESWKIVTKFTDLEAYASCAATWIDMLLQHYQDKHVLILLKDLVRHVRSKGDDAAKTIVTPLERVVASVTKYSSNFGEILAELKAL